jgi:hypothetical protein
VLLLAAETARYKRRARRQRHRDRIDRTKKDGKTMTLTTMPPVPQAGSETVTKPLASMMGPTSCSFIMAIMRETS